MWWRNSRYQRHFPGRGSGPKEISTHKRIWCQKHKDPTFLTGWCRCLFFFLVFCCETPAGRCRTVLFPTCWRSVQEKAISYTANLKETSVHISTHVQYCRWDWVDHRLLLSGTTHCMGPDDPVMRSGTEVWTPVFFPVFHSFNTNHAGPGWAVSAALCFKSTTELSRALSVNLHLVTSACICVNTIATHITQIRQALRKALQPLRPVTETVA